MRYGGAMNILVTGSAGHLGEGIMRTLRRNHHRAIGLDVLPSPYTDCVGSIVDRAFVAGCMKDIDAVIHTATLHKPHVATHARQAFIDTNVTGTLHLLEEAVAAGIQAFLFTSTTSTFGHANRPPAGAPAAWITEDVRPMPRNIYGVSKTAAEDLCELFHQDHGLPCLILKTSRFFMEEDDDRSTRERFSNDNVKANEYINRRVELSDAVDAHLLALERARDIGFRRYIISATTPFTRDDLAELRTDAPAVLARRVPAFARAYAQRGWHMFPGIERVYVNERARRELGWRPKYDFAYLIEQLQTGQDTRSELSRAVGCKPYHDRAFADGPYPVT